MIVRQMLWFKELAKFTRRRNFEHWICAESLETKSVVMRSFGLVIATFCTCFSPPALAWDGVVTGKVVQIDLGASGTNYGFRVALESVPTICTGGPSWAYINATEGNYQAIASALMLAYSSGKTVSIFSNLDSSGYCKMGYVVLRPPA